jgi:hypothetical protein
MLSQRMVSSMMAVKPRAVIGKTGRCWMIQVILTSLLTAMFSAMGGAIVCAETQELNYVIDSSDNQNYAAVIEQAEAVAGNSIARAFAENPTMTEILVKVTGDRNGSLSPLLFVKVSRADWQNQPNVQTWAQYLGDASVLLGYRGGSRSSTVASTPFPAPAVSSETVNQNSNQNSEPNFYN